MLICCITGPSIKIATCGKRKSSFRRRTFFGQLLRIFVINLIPLDLPKEDAVSRPYILLEVAPCLTMRDPYGFYEYTSYNKTTEVIDASAARALIGRIWDNEKWVLVRRVGVVEHADYHDASGDVVEDIDMD